MIPTFFSSIFFSIFFIIVTGIHPHQQQNSLSHSHPSIQEGRIYEYSHLNGTSFLEAETTIDGLDWELIQSPVKILSALARKSMSASAEARVASITTYENVKHKLVPKYITKAPKTLPSIYVEDETTHEWYRFRLQHDDGPAVTNPHFVESFCAPTEETVRKLLDKVDADMENDVSVTSKQVDEWVKEIGNNLKKIL